MRLYYLDVDAGGLRISVVPCGFRGSRVRSTEVSKAVGGWRVFKGRVFYTWGETSGIKRRSNSVHFVMLHFFFSAFLCLWVQISLLLVFNLTPDLLDGPCNWPVGNFQPPASQYLPISSEQPLLSTAASYKLIITLHIIINLLYIFY